MRLAVTELVMKARVRNERDVSECQEPVVAVTCCCGCGGDVVGQLSPHPMVTHHLLHKHSSRHVR